MDVSSAFGGERAQQGRWSCMSHFILRQTGFPFDWLQQLHFEQSVCVIQEILQHLQQQKVLQQAFESQFSVLCEQEAAQHKGKAVFRFWYRLARCIRRGQDVDETLIQTVRAEHQRPQLADWLREWHALCTHLQDLHQRGEDIFSAELRAKRMTLRTFVNTEAFQEALWLSSSSAYQSGWEYYQRHWEAESRPFKIKHLERRFYLYLQRFCAKNDTTSFYGPLNYGAFSLGNENVLRQAPVAIRKRRVFFAYWGAEEIARCIAQKPEVQVFLAPRHNPLCMRRIGMQDDVIVYHASDGKRSCHEIAQVVHYPIEQVQQSVTRLVQSGHLFLDIPIPGALLDPLGYLIAKVRDLQQHVHELEDWLAFLCWCQEVCQRFAMADLAQRQRLLADLEERYVLYVGGEAHRGQGKMFQDRTLIYEECLGDVETFRLSAQHRATFTEALAPILELSASYSGSLLEDLQTTAIQLYDELCSGAACVPYIHFITTWKKRYPHVFPSPRAEQLQKSLSEIVRFHTHEHLCRLSRQDIAALCNMPTLPVVVSPDVLLAASTTQDVFEHNYQLVLGEIHHGIQAAGWMLSFVEQDEEWMSEITAALPTCTDGSLSANLLLGRHMKTASPEFSGETVQASGVSLHEQSIMLNQLVVEKCGQQLVLHKKDEKQALYFYPPSYGIPEALYAPFACFSYPLAKAMTVRLGAHTPRIEIEGVVYQRERWDIPTSQIPLNHTNGTAFQLLVDLIDFQQRMGLPEHVFVSSPKEPKPVYICFHTYFALELLVHLATQADVLSFVEMYPDPQTLWLEHGNGRHTCELRTVFRSSPSSGHVQGKVGKDD